MKHKITGMLAVIGLFLTGCHIHIKSKHLKPQPTIRQQKEEVKKIKNEDEELEKTSQNKRELETNPKPRFDRPNMKIKKDP